MPSLPRDRPSQRGLQDLQIGRSPLGIKGAGLGLEHSSGPGTAPEPEESGSMMPTQPECIC